MFKNFLWDFIGRLGGQALSFAFSVVLTRLISPEEYGLMGMAAAVIAIAGVFLDMGFRAALVQKLEVSKEEYTGVFYISLAVSLILTSVCFFCAIPIANFYRQPQVEAILQALSLVFILNAFLLIPNAIVYKRMNFRMISVFNIIAAATSGTVGIFLAYQGYGVWSLVVQTLVSSGVLLILYQSYVRWLPSLQFQRQSVVELWRYGSKMFLANLSDGIFSRLDVFIISRLFPVQIVGFYARAQTFDQLIKQFSANGIVSVLFPHIAALQSDIKELRSVYVKYLHLVSFISFGLAGLLFIIAEPLFILLFTAKWLFAAELFKIMALTAFAWPVSALMCNIIAGVGNSKALLWLELPKRIIMLLAFGFGFLWGVKGLLYGTTVAACVSVGLNAFVAGKQIEVSLGTQCKIIVAYLLTAGIAILLTLIVVSSIVLFSHYLNLVLGSIVFCFSYLTANYLTKAVGLVNLMDKFLPTKSFKTSIP